MCRAGVYDRPWPLVLPGYYFLIAIAVGVVLGFFLSGYIKDLALTIVYSIQGGFLVGSCVSYTFWRGSMV